MLGFQAGYETDFAQGLLGAGATVTSDVSPVGGNAVNSVGWVWEQTGHIRAAADGVSRAADAQIARANEVSGGLGNTPAGVTGSAPTPENGRYIDPLTVEFAPGADLPLTPATAEMVSDAIREFGVPVYISETTFPRAGSSFHSVGKAVDISRIEIDGMLLRLTDSRTLSKATQLQEIFAQNPNIRENFGPAFNQRVWQQGHAPVPTKDPRVIEAHRNHIHVSGWR
jgi:hypothetical protein